jgi:peptidyl-prolyl cis-trans isomerase D
MAMMISKFHKLIQSRILWGIFLVVIICSFIIWGVVWPSDIEEADRVNAAGLIDGEPVSHGEFRSAYLSTYMARALTLGRDVASTPENEAILRRLSWQRLATLREAAKLGIGATEDELVGAIRSNFTDEQGRYLRQQYDAFLQNLIRPMGFTPAQFEQHVREEIIMQKLGSLVGRQAHVTPLEIRRTYDTLMDSFSVDYALIPLEEIEQGVSVSAKEARALYDADPEAFRLPEQREVRYAAIPIAGQLDEETEIPEDDILDFYEQNLADFTTTAEGEDGQPRQTIAGLDEVRDDIVATLRRNAAVAKADAIGTELAFSAIPGSDGRIPDFAEQTEKAGYPAQSLPRFDRFEVPVADAGAAFAAMAFELEEGPYDRVSTPVIGEDHVYVLYLDTIHPPRVPEFDEARDRVMDAAKRKAVLEAISAKAKAIQDDAVAGLAAGQSFAQAVQKHGVAVKSTGAFTGLTGSSSEDEAIQALVQVVVAYNQGEVTEPVPTAEGLMVAYLASREPADPASFSAYRDEIAGAIRSRRAQGLFMDWQANLLDPARFTDLQRQTLPDFPEDEEQELDEDAGADEA